MAACTVRARGPVPADEVWDRYAVPARWPTWSPQITRVSCDAARMAPGVRGTVHSLLGISVDFVVDTWDEADRTWSWTAWRGPLRLELEHGVAARGGETDTWLRVHGPLPVIVGYAPLAQFALHRLVHMP